MQGRGQSADQPAAEGRAGSGIQHDRLSSDGGFPDRLGRGSNGPDTRGAHPGQPAQHGIGGPLHLSHGGDAGGAQRREIEAGGRGDLSQRIDVHAIDLLAGRILHEPEVGLSGVAHSLLGDAKRPGECLGELAGTPCRVVGCCEVRAAHDPPGAAGCG
ncbi:hypothetical protein SDC9_130695 [bioreactor metagenome]|uniref:Uncharacterized protein n=1 Tax=bioreactor metagenome TaxID=1076179 RepID=A0A645D2N9_9ZZZZ